MNLTDGARKLHEYAMFENEHLDGYTKTVYRKLSMADTGIVTSPICRTKDYRQKIRNKEFNHMIPPEILYDIKNA